MKFDMHNHIGIRKGAAQTAEEILERMDRAEVDRALVFAFPEAIDNDYVVQALDAHADRFVGAVLVNAWDEDAPAIVREYAQHPGMRALKLHPMRHGFAVDKYSLMDPIFEVCAEERLHVVVHTTSDNPFCSPYQVEEMARRFPTVTFQMAHIGVMWGTDQAVRAAGRNDNVYLETSSASGLALKKAVKEAGAGKLLWGTDSPFFEFEMEELKVRLALPEPEVQAQVVGQNALRLFNLAEGGIGR